jgi:CheY-like chemotaxis protein
VIDDNPTHLKLVAVVLSAAGHKVSDADAAQQALLAIKQEKPEIILVDLVLPDMDGLTLVRNLKADPESRSIPIIAVTAYPDRFGKKDALAAGCDAYIVKPIDTRQLPRLVSDVAKDLSPGGE